MKLFLTYSKHIYINLNHTESNGKIVATFVVTFVQKICSVGGAGAASELFIRSRSRIICCRSATLYERCVI
jgi:hypothetical protein